MTLVWWCLFLGENLGLILDDLGMLSMYLPDSNYNLWALSCPCCQAAPWQPPSKFKHLSWQSWTVKGISFGTVVPGLEVAKHGEAGGVTCKSNLSVPIPESIHWWCSCNYIKTYIIFLYGYIYIYICVYMYIHTHIHLCIYMIYTDMNWYIVLERSHLIFLWTSYLYKLYTVFVHCTTLYDLKGAKATPKSEEVSHLQLHVNLPEIQRVHNHRCSQVYTSFEYLQVPFQ